MYLQINFVRLLLIIFVLSIAACNGETRDPVDQQATAWRSGTVTYVDLEGGFYGIVDDDGRQYDPLNLSESFQQDGLRVRFRGDERDDVATIRQWGTVLEITEIEEL